MKGKHILISIIFILANVFIGHSQSSSNPFDLSYRKSNNHIYNQSEYTESKDSATIDNVDTIIIEDTTDYIEETSSEDSSKSSLENITIEKQNDQKKIEDLVEVKPIDSSDGLFSQNILKKNSLIFGVLLILMLILTTIITLNRQISSRIFKSFMNDNFLNLLLREQKGSINIQYFYLYLFFIINLGLFLFIYADRLLNLDVKVTLFNCILVVFIIYVIRYITMIVIARVFDIRKIASQYNFTIVIFNIFLSFLLLPINLFAAFSPIHIAKYIIYIGIGTIGVIYLFRQLRGLFISSPFINSNKFYFILYLCTVEIAPILVVVKLMGSKLGL